MIGNLLFTGFGGGVSQGMGVCGVGAKIAPCSRFAPSTLADGGLPLGCLGGILPLSRNECCFAEGGQGVRLFRLGAAYLAPEETRGTGIGSTKRDKGSRIRDVIGVGESQMEGIGKPQVK